MKYILIIITGVLFVLVVTLFFHLTWKAKKGKTQQVREQYVLKAFSLLTGLAADLIVALVGQYSIADFLADLFQIDHQRTPITDIIGMALAFGVFAVCAWLFFHTYKNWPGETSNREHYMRLREDAELDGIESALKACAVALRALFKADPRLKPYVQNDRTAFAGSYSGESYVWHEECAKLYMLMTNQVQIDIKKDWHPQEHCYISRYGDNRMIAILCTNDMPQRTELERYVQYIRGQNDAYDDVIVAIKNGRSDKQDLFIGKTHVKFIYKEDVLDRLVDFSAYFDALHREYAEPLMGSCYTIDDVYVEPYCQNEEGTETYLLHQYIEKWLKEPGMRQVALLGDFGQGKTVFSNYLAHKMIGEQNQRIPILIRLRNKSPRNSTPLEIMSYFAALYGINPESLLLLNENGRLLLIFDGFDEMDLVGTDSIRKMHFQHLWELAAPQSKILITGRPNYFPSQAEMRSALSLRAGAMSIPRCDAVFLKPFDQDQIMRALRSCGPSVVNGIRHLLARQASESFADLISRPSHLFLVSLIWDERKIAEKYQNLSSALIIDEFLQNCFERQESKSQRNPYHFLSPIEREYFMIGIAMKMYRHGLTTISSEVFESTVEDLVSIFPEKLSEENSAALNLRNGKSVKEFAYEDKHSMSAIENDVRTCGLLVNDYVNCGLMFAHKSFYELLVAKFFLGKSVHRLDTARVISMALSTSSEYAPPLKNDYVVRKLLAELIASKISLGQANASAEEICGKIFTRCLKAMKHIGFRQTPEKLFLKCLRQETQPLHENKKDVQRAARRFLYLVLFFFVVCVAFIVRTITISVQHYAAAIQYYEEMAPIIGSAGIVLSNAPGYSQIAICGAIIVLFVMYLVFRAPASKADLILLTWYHACLDNGVSETVILRCFTKRNAALFKQYLRGANLTKLQEQLAQRRRSISIQNRYIRSKNRF